MIIDSTKDIIYRRLFETGKSYIGFSFGAPFIFDQDDIDKFDGNLINSHGSPLPEYKGGGGYSWRILQNDKRGSTLIHLINTKIDEGSIVFRKDFTFEESDRLPIDYHNKQLLEDRKNILPWLKLILSGEKEFEIIDKNQSKNNFETYFPRLSTDHHGFLDWQMNIDHIERFICAFSYPYSGAKTFIRGKLVSIIDCKRLSRNENHPYLIGLITSKTSEELIVALIDGFIKIKLSDLKSDIEDIKINIGDRFLTPKDILDERFNKRIFYTPNGINIKDYQINYER